MHPDADSSIQNMYFSAKFATMRKTIYLLLALLTVITSCSNKKNDFTLKGKISGLSSDTLLVYYQVPEYKLDTIFCKNGVFEYNLEPDTTTMFSLIFNVAESLPIFAEKGGRCGKRPKLFPLFPYPAAAEPRTVPPWRNVQGAGA